MASVQWRQRVWLRQEPLPLLRVHWRPVWLRERLRQLWRRGRQRGYPLSTWVLRQRHQQGRPEPQVFRRLWQLVRLLKYLLWTWAWLRQPRGLEQPELVSPLLLPGQLQVRQTRPELPMQRPRQQRLLFQPVLSQGFPPSSAFLEHHRRSQSTWQTRYYNNRIRSGGCRTFEINHTESRQTRSDSQASLSEVRLENFLLKPVMGGSKRMSERRLSALDSSELCHPFDELTTVN